MNVSCVSGPPSHAVFDISFLVDPWFNFRATKYLVKNGFYSFWDWFDDRGLLSALQ